MSNKTAVVNQRAHLRREIHFIINRCGADFIPNYSPEDYIIFYYIQRH